MDNINQPVVYQHKELIEKLQQKIRTYKKQVEDAEEIAALNLAKLVQYDNKWIDKRLFTF